MNEPQEVLGVAVLANVHIQMWEARKHDREITNKVNEEHAASREAGRWHKQLFGGKTKELSAVQGAVNNLRAVHYAQTLPWSDSGWRILTTANVFEYRKAMRVAVKRFDEAVDRLVKRYPVLREEARKKLNGMYKESDYPSAAEVRERYAVSLDYSPIPTGSDFRVELPKKELDEMSKQVERRVAESVEQAMSEAWSRLGKAVSKLSEYLDDGKGLRDTMIERLGDLVEVLGRLNLTGDTKLDQMRVQVQRDLTGLSAANLRKDEGARADAKQKAAAILKQMKSMYNPGKEDA